MLIYIVLIYIIIESTNPEFRYIKWFIKQKGLFLSWPQIIKMFYQDHSSFFWISCFFKYLNMSQFRWINLFTHTKYTHTRGHGRRCIHVFMYIFIVFSKKEITDNRIKSEREYKYFYVDWTSEQRYPSNIIKGVKKKHLLQKQIIRTTKGFLKVGTFLKYI